MSHAVNVDEYMSPSFEPAKIANALLRATTTAQDTTVDINPALTRLKYDLDEIDQNMANVAKANTSSLLEHAEAVEKADAEIGSLSPVLENVTTTYGKLESDFLMPFRRAQQLHGVAQQLHEAAVLSRGLSWYLQLALQAQNQDFKRESVIVNGGAGASLLRSAQALTKMQDLLAAMPRLEEFDAVAQFQTRVADLRSAVLDSATNVIREFNGKDRSHLKLAVLGLHTLGADLQQAGNTYLKTLVGTTVLQLSRNSGAVDAFQKAFEGAQARAATTDAVGSVLAEVQPGDTPITAERFWSQVAAQLDQKLRTMSVANPSAVKAISAIGDKILASTQAVEAVHNVFKSHLSK